MGDRRDRHLLLEVLLRLFVEHGALVAVGDEMRAAVDAARASSDSHARTMIIEHVTSASAAAAMLRDRIGARDVVLVKGSRGMRMEGVIAALGSGDHAVERVGP